MAPSSEGFLSAGRARDAAVAAADPRRAVAREIPVEVSDDLHAARIRSMRRKVVVWIFILLPLCYLSFGIIGGTAPFAMRYTLYDPVTVALALVQGFCDATGLFGLTPLRDAASLYVADGNGSGYWILLRDVICEKAGIVGVTLVCAVLLSVSGMLYQNVFRNPLAGPGMLGVSSGVTLGMMLMVYQFGADAAAMTERRYLYCYLLGAAVLLAVVLAGRRLSGRGRPLDIMSMLLVGMILSQLVGFVTSFYTLYVMDDAAYTVFVTLSEMLVVDVTWVSWAVLGLVCLVTLAPVYLLRFRMNALALSDEEARLSGVNLTALRAVALVAGALMILAAQVHIGAVALVSLIVPFLSRAWFGCDFRAQLLGNVCVSTVLMVACRDIVDLVPFVGDGIGIGCAVSAVALPLFMVIMARNLRGWD